jgi:hypothetical protein
MNETQQGLQLKKLLHELNQKINSSDPSLHEFYLREMDWFLEEPSRVEMFEHRPMPIEEWIEAPYAGNVASVLRPRVKQMLTEIFQPPLDEDGKPDPDPMKTKYDEVVIIGGIGIGKSFISGASVGYMMHRLACLRNPKGFFNLGGANPIAIMNMSVNGTQAKKVVFGQIIDSTNAPWFQNVGFVADKDVRSELRFPKYVQVMPGNSMDTFFIGFDLFVGILDEGAWHNVTEDKDYAEEGYSAMQRRIKSRFPGRGMLFIVTSPRYVDDFVERKIREAATNPRIYARRVRSWESLPPLADVSKFFYFDPDRDIIYTDEQVKKQGKRWAEVVEDRTIVTPKSTGRGAA